MIWKWKKRNFWIWRISRRNRQTGVNYCFLDFDGVINLLYEEGSPKYLRLIENLERGLMADEDAVKRLSDFCLKYQMRIVISSSWRYGGLHRCQTYLHQSGLDQTIPIVGLTGLSFHSSREQLIYEYLQAHPNFKSVLIIDDMDMENLRQYLVHTEPIGGFNEAAQRTAETKLAQQLN